MDLFTFTYLALKDFVNSLFVGIKGITILLRKKSHALDTAYLQLLSSIIVRYTKFIVFKFNVIYQPLLSL
jgi:hypothetical protein